jgi:hypothetical protein
LSENLFQQFQSIKKQREQEDKEIFTLLKTFMDKVKKDLDTEKEERLNMEKTILSLLESTCDKITDISS